MIKPVTVIWRTVTGTPLAPPMGELAAPKGAHLRGFSADRSYCGTLSVSLTAASSPKGRAKRGVAVSARQVTICLPRKSGWYDILYLLSHIFPPSPLLLVGFFKLTNK